MKYIISLFSGVVFLLTSCFSYGQFTFFTPNGSFAIEISLDNPPTGLVRLPIYQNSISSLTVIGEIVVGGTKATDGLSPYLFTASLSKKSLLKTYDLKNILKDQRSIQSGFVKGKGGVLYAGTISNGEGNSGHIIEATIDKNGEFTVKDLGIPIKGQGIFSLTGDKNGTELYGISYPSGIFFSFNIRSGDVTLYNDVVPTKDEIENYQVEFALGPDKYLSRSLIRDNKGRIFGSAPVNRLFYFDPSTRKISFLKDSIPFVWGRDVLGRIDSWTKGKDGTLYGGNGGDGQLFSINPATLRVTNLGKPIMMNRIPGLSFGKDGVLYGIGGAEPGYAHLFKYSADKGFYDLGNPQFVMKAPGIEQGIDWRGFRIGTMASSEDGRYIVMGEDEALSQLMVFPVSDK